MNDICSVAEPGKCVKCKTADYTIRIRHADYCEPCFIQSVQLKFRQSMGRFQSLISRRGEPAMVAFSGGPSSAALLQLTYEFCFHSDDLNRRKFSRLIVCNIDCSSLEESVVPNSWMNSIRSAYPEVEPISVPLELLFDGDSSNS